MKGYKFKLEALLKIRKLKEEQCKMQIGRIQVEISQLDQKIEDRSSYIGEAFTAQEIALQEGASGKELAFYPYFVEGNRASIRDIKQKKRSLEKQVQQLYLQLNKLRADVKVISKMKEKDQIKYKKNLEKKEFQNLEEQVQNWKRSLG